MAGQASIPVLGFTQWPACLGPSLPKADGGCEASEGPAWPSRSSLALRLKGAWKPHVAIRAPPLTSVPFHSFGTWFQY